MNQAKVSINPNVTDLIIYYAKQLAEFTGYKETGYAFIKKCEKELRSLEIFPERCRPAIVGRNERELIVNNHVFLYYYDEIENTVYVVNMKSCKENKYRSIQY